MGFDSILTKLGDGNDEGLEKPQVSHIVVSVDQETLERGIAQAIAKMVEFLNANEEGVDCAKKFAEDLVATVAGDNEAVMVLLEDRLNDCIEKAEDGGLGIELDMVAPSEGGPNLTDFNTLATEVRSLLGEDYTRIKRVLAVKTGDVQSTVKKAVEAVTENEAHHNDGNPYAIVSRGF